MSEIRGGQTRIVRDLTIGGVLWRPFIGVNRQIRDLARLMRDLTFPGLVFDAMT